MLLILFTTITKAHPIDVHTSIVFYDFKLKKLVKE